MSVALLLTAGDGECLVLAPDGKVFKRDEHGEQTLALDPATTKATGDGKDFDFDNYARHATRWGLYRVVGPDNTPYPHFHGHGLPEMELASLESGEPVYRVKGEAAPDAGA